VTATVTIPIPITIVTATIPITVKSTRTSTSTNILVLINDSTCARHLLDRLRRPLVDACSRGSSGAAWYAGRNVRAAGGGRGRGGCSQSVSRRGKR